MKDLNFTNEQIKAILREKAKELATISYFLITEESKRLIVEKDKYRT